MFDFVIIVTTMQHTYKGEIIKFIIEKNSLWDAFFFQYSYMAWLRLGLSIYMIIECWFVINFNTKTFLIITHFNERFRR